jgi:hypothetical protein
MRLDDKLAIPMHLEIQHDLAKMFELD